MEDRLIELEDKIVKFLESKEFDDNVENENQIYELMRTLKSQMVTYFEILQKLSSSEIDSENPLEHTSNTIYNPQGKFIEIMQLKSQKIFQLQRSSYLISKGFVMNNKTIKILGEFLHAYINFIVKYKNFIVIEKNQEAIEFASEQLSNSQSQKDILTSCSIIFWSLLTIHKQITDQQFKFELLCDLLKNKDPISIFRNEKIEQQGDKQLSIGILYMAKLRGYILTLEKESEFIELLSFKTQHLMLPEKCSSLFDFVLLNCEKNEGLQKLYSFNTLEALVTKMKGISDDQEDWLYRTSKVLISYLKYPLPVSSCCEATIKKLLAISNKKQVGNIIQIIKSLSQGHELRAKYTALYIALNYMSVKEYLQENEGSIEEMITLSADSIVVGKFVTGFFEGLMQKLHDLASIEGKPQSWFESWIPAYLKAINQEDEKIRVSVCQNVTPILIKINKLSLAYILSNFLKYQNQDQQNYYLESLMILLRIARQNKMIQICDESKDLKLQSNFQEQLSKLQEQGVPDFSIEQSDLLKILATNNWKMSLECFSIVAQETKASISQKDQQENEQLQTISQFEYKMCELFALQCTKTTFPEHRKHFMQSIRTFLTRVRSANLKKIKAYVASNSDQKCDDLNQLLNFFNYIIGFCQDNLYVDKPIEAALPFFEILIMIQNFFGDFDYQLRVNHVLPAVRLLSKEKLLESKQLIMYLLNCLKSSWALVRVYSFEILCKIPDNNAILTDEQFINQEILSTALIFCNNPKAMVAEGASLLLKFLFKKCLKQLHFIKPSENTRGMQLQFCQYILSMLKQRIQVFHHTLINEGKTSALLHGLLGFFKNLFLDFKIQREDLQSEEDFQQWRQFFKDFIEISLQISNLCSGLLGNNRIQDQEGNTKVFDQQIETDCRGHPIFDRSGIEGKTEGEFEDQDNLILVGVWLAEKENGLTLFNLLSWIELPNQEIDDNKFLQDQDIIGLCDNILNLLFTYKHRGAIEKAAESFSLLCVKLLNSNRIKFKNIPLEMLQKAFERITTENHSTVLRRSAGIPPTILAILRAEPISNEPILLNKTLEFLLDLARQSKDTDDAKIHALNILRFIFQDSFLKNDINKFITPAMILATENFKSESWSIRNSALMCFTSLTKRLLNTTTVQDQDLSRKKGLSTWEFVTKYSQLSDYFKATLKECLVNKKKLSKENKERSDMVVFSILLLISRLVPSFQMIDSQNLEEQSDQQQNQGALKVNQLDQHSKSKELSIRDFAVLIKGYAHSDTYFVRKISAQALLTIMKFDEYIPEISECFGQLISKVEKQKECKMRQNEAHGLMIRINIFLEAYYKYRAFNMQLSTKSGDDQIFAQNQEQNQLSKIFIQFFEKLTEAESTFQLIIISLYVKSLKLFVQKSEQLDNQFVQNLSKTLLLKIIEIISKIQKDNDQNINYQVYLTDLTKTFMILLGQNELDNFECIKSISSKILGDISLIKSRTDYTFKFLKSLYQQLKNLQRQKNNDEIQEYLSGLLIEATIPEIVQMNDEKLCKVLEWSLKVVFRLNKHKISGNLLKKKEDFHQMLSLTLKQFEVNPCLTSLYIKLQTLMIDTSNPASLRWIGKILRKYGYGDQKEIVRIATVKSISKILEQIDIQNQGVDCLDLIFASVLILNDENPEVRSYLTQSKSVQNAFIDCEQYALKSQSLYQSRADVSSKDLIVEVNEVILIQQIIQRMGSIQAEPAIKREIVNSFLLDDMLMANPYREQNEKNYEEKIFLFEPINKYFDLLWLKRIAFKQLNKEENKKLIDGNKLNEYMSNCDRITQKWQQNLKVSNGNIEIAESSLQFENKIDKLMLQIISSQKISADSISTGSKSYLLSLV